MVWSRLGRLTGLRARRPVKPIILMYHRIAFTARDPWELAVTPPAFETQMRELARRRRVLPLAEFADLHTQGRLPADAAAITFDDGYACNANVAAPILEALGLPATFFLATAMLGSEEEFWADALERVVFDPAAGGTVAVTVLGREIRAELGPEYEDRPADRLWKAMEQAPSTPRQRAYLTLWEALKQVPFDVQYAAIAEVARQAGNSMPPRRSHRPMTPEEARRLAAREGVAIAGHSVTHLSLPLWSSEVQVREIRNSRAACEEISARSCPGFAYPYGDVSDVTISCAAEAGIRWAVTTRPRALEAADAALSLPRFMVRNTTQVEALGVG